jgi:hypothetical protein
MKSSPGSGRSSLFAADLVDGIRLFVHPLVLGSDDGCSRLPNDPYDRGFKTSVGPRLTC